MKLLLVVIASALIVFGGIWFYVDVVNAPSSLGPEAEFKNPFPNLFPGSDGEVARQKQSPPPSAPPPAEEVQTPPSAATPPPPPSQIADSPPSEPPGPRTLSGWSYRKSLLMSATSNLADYQVAVNLDTAALISSGKMRSDCGDARFTASDGATLLSYWIESGCNSVNTKVWVRVPSIAASGGKIYFYYGNLSAALTSNGRNTFLAFDLKNEGPIEAGEKPVLFQGFHTCGLVLGAIKCWGSNNDGELGNGTNSSASTPATVSGISSAIAIAGGSGFTCTLLSIGSVKCWGNNLYGRLGDGTNTYRNAPVSVLELSSARYLATGGQHACAMTSDGGAKCWGSNSHGQLGDGTTQNKNTPVSVVGLNNAIAISGGGTHTCALINDGSVKCWGWNVEGQLGMDLSTFGPGTDKHTPTLVPDVSGAAAVSAGLNFTCALINDGKVKCWGGNGSGQLGIGKEPGHGYSPTTVVGVSNAIAVAGGDYHTCALIFDGTVKCWGSNSNGQLGNGTTVDTNTPINVLGVSNAVALAAGSYHTCVLLNDGSMKCWGNNKSGQLGIGSKTDQNITPISITNYNLGGRYDKTRGINTTPHFSDIYFVRKYSITEPSIVNIGEEEKIK